MNGDARPRLTAEVVARQLARSIQEGIPALDDLKSKGCEGRRVWQEYLCLSYHFSWKGIYANVADEAAGEKVAAALYRELDIGMTPEEVVERADSYEQIIAQTSARTVFFGLARQFLRRVKAPDAEGYVVIMALALGAHLSGIAGLSITLAKVDFI